MSSIRSLKKNITYISSELFAECVFSRIYLPNTDLQQVDEVMVKILTKENEFLRRANRPDGKKNPELTRKYFKKLKDDFAQHIEDVINDIQTLNK